MSGCLNDPAKLRLSPAPLPILMVGFVVEPVLIQRKPFLARPLLRQNPRAVSDPSALRRLCRGGVKSPYPSRPIHGKNREIIFGVT